MSEKAKTINKDCPCKSNCVRHGDCEACRAYHKGQGSLTSCQRAAQQK